MPWLTDYFAAAFATRGKMACVCVARSVIRFSLTMVIGALMMVIRTLETAPGGLEMTIGKPAVASGGWLMIGRSVLFLFRLKKNTIDLPAMFISFVILYSGLFAVFAGTGGTPVSDALPVDNFSIRIIRNADMSKVKNIAKTLIGLLAGIIIGMVVSTTLIILFTDTTFAEFAGKFTAVKLADLAFSVLVALLGLVISLGVLVPLHEAGHLVCGLLTGYKFVSFRIFSLTLIRRNGKYCIKRFSIAGTGGQCLLAPPEVPIDKMPTVLYNAGGLIANVLALLPAVWMVCTSAHPLAKEFWAVFIMTDMILLLINGIPMKIGGMGNDAYNMLWLGRNHKSKLALSLQLRANALIQEGVRPKDMPDELFVEIEDVDYSNPMEVSFPIMAAGRLLDEMKWQEARKAYEELYAHKGEIISLYVKEISCELVFLALITGDADRARELYDGELQKYIGVYRSMMSSKERVLCSVALLLENDRDKARRIYDTLVLRKDDYLFKGEVCSDLALMEWMLDNCG